MISSAGPSEEDMSAPQVSDKLVDIVTHCVTHRALHSDSQAGVCVALLRGYRSRKDDKTFVFQLGNCRQNIIFRVSGNMAR